MKDTIKNIHESNLYGILFEAGAGVGISHGLMEEPGASKTIHAVHSLYSEQAVAEHFNWPSVTNHKKFERSVSAEAVKAILKEARHETTHAGVNFTIVSSFQVPTNPMLSKHGWIGLRYDNSEKYYHITIPNSFSRRKAIREISRTGIKILWGRNSLPLSDTYVDFVINEDGSHDVTYTFETLSLTNNNLAVVAALRDKKVVFSRLEKILRHDGNIVFYRGSFNPWHQGHTFVRNQIRDLPVFPCLTVRPFQKDSLHTHELKDRALNLLYENKGPIVLTTLPYFKDFYQLCKGKHGNNRVGFLMGDDTLRRVVECNDIDLFQNQKVDAICVSRNGYRYPGEANISYISKNPHKDVSSTLIRTKTKH